MGLSVPIPLLQIVRLFPPPLCRLDTLSLDVHLVDGNVLRKIVERVGEEIGACGEEVRDGGCTVVVFEADKEGKGGKGTLEPAWLAPHLLLAVKIYSWGKLAYKRNPEMNSPIGKKPMHE